MAAPFLASAAKLLIKPVLNELKKAAIKKAAATGTAKAAGLGVRELTKLSNLDILNLVRAAVVKGTKAEVAKSLGITVKELNATIADITLTETRKNAVKGANYIKNANRFLKDPIKTIGGEGKRKIAQEISSKTREALDEIEEQKKTPQEIELELLQDTLFSKSKKLKLRKEVWDNVNNIDLFTLREIRFKAESDQYYSHVEDETIVQVLEAGGRGGGYKMGYDLDDYLDEIHELLLKGYAVIPHKDGKF